MGILSNFSDGIERFDGSDRSHLFVPNRRVSRNVPRRRLQLKGETLAEENRAVDLGGQ